MSIQFREEVIAEITIRTAEAISKASEKVAALIEKRKNISWWRFLARYRLKKQIAAQTAQAPMIAVMAAVKIAQVIATPIFKHKPVSES